MNKNPYSFENIILRIKRHLKNFFTSYLEILKNLASKLNESQFKIIKASFFFIFIFIIGSISYYAIQNQYEYLHRLDGPTVNRIILTDSSFGKVEYSGEIINGNIKGNGILTIRSDEWKITYNGNFENDNVEKKELLTIGKFVKGKIEIVNLKTNNRYMWSGEFDINGLRKGILEKNIKNTKIIYSGIFENNRLEGVGSKYVSIDGFSKMYKGWFEKGELIK